MQAPTDDIDFMLTLNPHGWSTCLVFVQGKVYELYITHVFGDPYYDFIHALELLMTGQNSVSFFWYDEPGGNQIEIVRLSSEKHKAFVRIQGFSESFGDEIKNLEELISFEININSLLIIAYLQLKKRSYR